MTAKPRATGRLARYVLIAVLVAFVLAGFVEPGFAEFSRGDTTPAGSEIIAGIDPGQQQLPDTFGELAMRWANSAGADTSYATAPDTVSTTVDTLAYPHMVSEPADGDTLEMIPNTKDTIPITAWNLGNAPDTFEVNLYDTHANFRYELRVEGDTDSSRVSTGEIVSIVENIEQPADTVGITLVVEHRADVLESHNITVEAKTDHGTAAWVDSDRGREAHVINIGIEPVDLEELEFDEEEYTGRMATGTLGAQAAAGLDTLPVLLWSVDEEGDTLSQVVAGLEETEEESWYEGEFGFTEGHSRVEEHPALAKEIPLVEIPGETTTIKARLLEDPERRDTAVWLPEPEPDHVDNLDDVRTWPSPFDPTDDEPFVFQDLPADETMEIFLFNTRGQRIRRLTVGRGIDFHEHGNRARWWGRNDEGSLVASGVYIYVIQSQYGVERGKVTIVK